MIYDKKEFGLGVVLIAAFLAALALIFAPLHSGGDNTLDYLDSTFNSISKASAYYIPAVGAKAAEYDGLQAEADVKAGDAAQAERMAVLLRAAGTAVTIDGARLRMSGDIGGVLRAAVADADIMFRNDGAAIAEKYGFDGKRALYDWHQAFGAISKDLTRQSRFKEAKMLREVQGKAIEPAYNYYGIDAVPMSRMAWIALAALAGYVAYTIWYGFAVMFLFEGWGLKLKH
ncbi:MAG TPA: hypothetical protein VF816_06135 [Rhodocyclaceae bacterium]